MDYYPNVASISQRPSIQTKSIISKSKKQVETPSFTPRINSISDDLDNRMRVLRTDTGPTRRYDTLYQLAVQKQEDMNIRRKYHIEETLRLELDGATFIPQTNYRTENGQHEYTLE